MNKGQREIKHDRDKQMYLIEKPLNDIGLIKMHATGNGRRIIATRQTMIKHIYDISIY